MHPPRRVLSLLPALAVVVAACTGSAGSSAAPSAGGAVVASASSGSVPCPTAPPPNPADPPGWPVPGSSATSSIFPVIVSSEQICGPNRFLFSFLDGQSNPVASPDRTASVAFYDLGRDPSKPVSTENASFLWAIQGARGLYVTNTTFGEAGDWGAEFTTSAPGSQPQTVRMRFQVKPTGSSIPVGGAAPSVKTPTAADVGGDLARISSDQHPYAPFYQTSVAQALADHKPFVLIFATPAFCTSGQCGPTLDLIKGVAAKEPGVTFINVEPYKLQYSNGRLQPVLDGSGQLQPVDATIAYGILTEPWIFVVDGNGKVSASFEAILSPEELTAAVDAVK